MNADCDSNCERVKKIFIKYLLSDSVIRYENDPLIKMLIEDKNIIDIVIATIKHIRDLYGIFEPRLFVEIVSSHIKKTIFNNNKYKNYVKPHGANLYDFLIASAHILLIKSIKANNIIIKYAVKWA